MALDDSFAHLNDPRRIACLIPASEASVAAGLNRYALPRSLWEVKIGKVVPLRQDSQATLHGKSNERNVRLHVAEILRSEIQKCEYHSHKNPEWAEIFGATPDGLIQLDPSTQEPSLIEIKCPYQSIEWNYIPPEYMAQIQLQLEVMQVRTVYFCAYFHKLEKIKIWRVYRSKQYWDWICPRLLTFAQCVQEERQPTQEDIPVVYFEAYELAKSNYDYSVLRQGSNRKDYPPKVFTQLIADESCTSEDLMRFERRSLVYRMQQRISRITFNAGIDDPDRLSLFRFVSSKRFLHVVISFVVLFVLGNLIR